MQGDKNVREKGALTSIHGGHGGHVPAANVLVERNRIKEHCHKVPHAPQATQNTPHQQKNEARSDFKKAFERIRKGK